MTTRRRFWEIDLLRTNAIVVMITFHTLYLLGFFRIHYTDLHTLFPLWFAAGGGTFIFLAGVSLSIAHSRAKKLSGFVKRGLRIFGLGMIITAITWVITLGQPIQTGLLNFFGDAFITQEFVKFGILHFFGITFMIGPLFLRFRFINLALGAALMATGFLLQSTSVDFPWLFWLGLRPHGFRAFDHIPLLPWFGLFLIGMFAGSMLYPRGDRGFRLPELTSPVIPVITFPGRHPLIIYLLQWPAIIGILLAVHPENVLPYFPF
ncbi:MAG: heparan-alpha-glucosaminide N-acetyltransferase [Dehalococcoidia bacterium]